MGHLAARLNLLNKAAQRPRYAALLKKLNLPIKILVVENSLSEFCSKLLLLAGDLKFNLTRSALHESLLSSFFAVQPLWPLWRIQTASSLSERLTRQRLGPAFRHSS